MLNLKFCTVFYKTKYTFFPVKTIDLTVDVLRQNKRILSTENLHRVDMVKLTGDETFADVAARIVAYTINNGIFVLLFYFLKYLSYYSL